MFQVPFQRLPQRYVGSGTGLPNASRGLGSDVRGLRSPLVVEDKIFDLRSPSVGISKGIKGVGDQAGSRLGVVVERIIGIIVLFDSRQRRMGGRDRHWNTDGLAPLSGA